MIRNLKNNKFCTKPKCKNYREIVENNIYCDYCGKKLSTRKQNNRKLKNFDLQQLFKKGKNNVNI